MLVHDLSDIDDLTPVYDLSDADINYLLSSGLSDVEIDYLLSGDLSNLDDLGISFFKRLFRIVMAPIKLVRKITNKIIPKPLRNLLSKVGKGLKKVFLKIAPVLAIAAQVLNFIPGLGIAVGLAITAGAAALQVTAQVMQAKEAGAKATAQATKAEAEANAQVAAAEKDAHEKADEAFAKGEEYFGPKYGIGLEAFKTLELMDKMAFFKMAIEDEQTESAMETYVLIGGAVIVVGVFTILLYKRKKKRRAAAAAAALHA